MEINHQVIREYAKGRIASLEDDMKIATKVSDFNNLYGRLKELNLLVEFINK